MDIQISLELAVSYATACMASGTMNVQDLQGAISFDDPTAQPLGRAHL